MNLSMAVGRRKTSVARVYIRNGSGTITVNGRRSEEYFPRLEESSLIHQPLLVTDNQGKYDLIVNVRGGGSHGQAGACRHAIARALVTMDETNYRALKSNGYLTRDSRMVERKKYGQPGARKKFQFSKR